MIQVIVFYSIKKDCTAQFAEVFRKIAPEVLKEEGCLQYELFVSPYDAKRFCLVEKWMSQTILDKHLATKHLAEFRVQTGPWFDQKPAIEIKNIENERHL